MVVYSTFVFKAKRWWCYFE